MPDRISITFRTALITVLLAAALAGDVALATLWRRSQSEFTDVEWRLGGVAAGYVSLPGRLRVYVTRRAPSSSPISWGLWNLCSMGAHATLPLHAGRGSVGDGLHLTGHYAAFILLTHLAFTTPAAVLWLRGRRAGPRPDSADL